MSDAHRAFVRAASGGCPLAGASGSASEPDAGERPGTGCPVASSSSAGCSSSSLTSASSSNGGGSTGCSSDAAQQHASRINMDVVPNAPLGSSASSASSSSSQQQPPADRLDTQRARSSIPMAAPDGGAAALPAHQGGVAGEMWMYPSQQQFYNAMKRKGWDPSEADMAQVVAIHNTVNERAWQHVLAWEALHAAECGAPRLKRFQGRPSDYSPKARLLNWMGFKLPFDRHDWVVDRCGREVRYVIDFYSGPQRPGAPPSMHLDVRPALDSPQALLDRLRMQARFIASGRWLSE